MDTSVSMLNDLMDYENRLRQELNTLRSRIEILTNLHAECGVRIRDAVAELRLSTRPVSVPTAPASPLPPAPPDDAEFKEKTSWSEAAQRQRPLEVREGEASAMGTKPLSAFKSVTMAACKISVPIIKTLSAIQPAVVWCEEKQGLFICIANGFYVEVPFPNLFDANDANARIGSIPCKYKTADSCARCRGGRSCNYAHEGDRLTKVGIVARCPRMPHLGTHSTLNKDIKTAHIRDIKAVLMYALSDVLLAVMWQQHNITQFPLVIRGTDIC